MRFPQNSRKAFLSQSQSGLESKVIGEYFEAAAAAAAKITGGLLLIQITKRSLEVIQ